jgi:uncharacterized protein (TIGR03437 family)
VKYWISLILPLLAGAAENWQLQTIAGGLAAGDGGPAHQASVRFLQGVATGPGGFIYFSDADDHRIRRIAPNGIITTLAGVGLPGFSGDNGPAHLARIHTPYGLAVSPSGEVVFADLGNARLRRINSQGIIETIAGGGAREIPPAGLYVPAVNVQLSAPRNVLVLPTGLIYFSDFGANRVLELRPDGTLTSIPLAATELRNPAGLTLDSDGQLLIADSGNARILRLRANGLVDIWRSASPDLPLERPIGLARRADGRILIADTRGDFLWEVNGNSPVQKLAPGGRDVAVDALGNVLTGGGAWLRRLSPTGFIDILINNTFRTFRGDGGPALDARLSQPSAVVVDPQGTIYFSDTGNHRIRAISPAGLITTVAGAGEPGFRGDGGLATQAFLHSPGPLALDSFGNLYVADTGNHRIRVFRPGGPIRTIAGNGRSAFSPDGLAATEASLSEPAGLAFDPQGRLCFSERGQHRIRRIDFSGRLETIAGNGLRGLPAQNANALTSPLNQPGLLAFDSQGALYFTDQNQTALAVLESGRIRILARDLNTISGLAASPQGDLYYSEASTQLVSRRTAAGLTEPIAGRRNENGFNSDSGPGPTLTLNSPAGLALHPDGSLILADRLNDRLRRLTPPPAIVESNTTTFQFLHAATFREGPIAPGQLLTLMAAGLTRPELIEITFDGLAAPILFANATQVNFQAPYGLAGRREAAIEVRMGGALLTRRIVDIVGANPGWFTAAGLIVAVNASGALNSDTSPARAGDVLTLYGTGEGLLRASGNLQVTLQETKVSIAGIPAEVLFAGAAPGFRGLLQVNLRVPPGIRLRGRVPVQLEVGPFRNPPNQLLAVE